MVSIRKVLWWGATATAFAAVFASLRWVSQASAIRGSTQRPPDASHVPEAVPTASWWRQPAVAIPIMVSVVALVLAVASYWDQHQADLATTATATRADASLVSFWTGTQAPIVVEVQNLSTVPVQDLMFEFGFNPAHSQRVSYVNIPIDGVLPPCTEAEFKTSSWYPLDEDPLASPLYLFFTSENAQVWQLEFNGTLQKGAYPTDVTVDATYAFTDERTIGACS
jgi:hypothetical protein